MHELGIARDLFKEVLKKTGGKKPERIKIVIGRASGIEEHFLRHSFEDHIFPEYGWQGVEIEIQYEEPALFCEDCKKEVKDINSFSCPFCGSLDLKILKGDRVYIKGIQ